MSAIRSEVHDFIRAAETLLSPASLDKPLTKDEFYVASPVEHYRTLAGDREDNEVQ
jgi:hypothetical protein